MATLSIAGRRNQRARGRGAHITSQTCTALCSSITGTMALWGALNISCCCTRNVQPWKYYTLGQIPNFLIAAPTAITCIAVCIHYIRSDPCRFFTLGFKGRRPSKSGQLYPFIAQDSLLPHVILMLLMLGYTAVLVHVQIIARLFSFQPLLYWALAHFYLSGPARTKKVIVCYALGYASIGSILFANFYPPA